MDRTQKPFESANTSATSAPQTGASAQRYPSNATTPQSNTANTRPSGSSFVGHVPGSDVEAGDRKSAFGSTVQRDAHLAGEDQAASPMATAGQKIEQFADAIRDKAPEGKVGELVTNAASALEKGGNYFGSADMDSVRGDMESLIRRYPVQSLAVGLGIGFLVARALRR